MAMLKVLLVRHAQCTMNLDIIERIGGRTNASPLTALGEVQARALGAHLQAALLHAGTPPQQIKFYSSTAVRAVATAKYVMEALQVDEAELVQSDQLLELEQGRWEGALRRECYTPQLTAQFAADPWGAAWNFGPPGGESQRQVEQRMAEFLTQTVLPSLTPGAPAIVVGHGMAIKCLLRGVLSSLPTMSRSIATGNTSITELGFVPSPTPAHNGSAGSCSAGSAGESGGTGRGLGINATLASCGGTWHILRVNDLSHLPFDLRS